MTQSTIESVLQRHRDHLMSLRGIVGTAIGICDGKPCIKVFVLRKSPQVMQKIPSVLEGYAVSIEESGEFRALG